MRAQHAARRLVMKARSRRSDSSTRARGPDLSELIAITFSSYMYPDTGGDSSQDRDGTGAERGKQHHMRGLTLHFRGGTQED